MSAVHDDVSTWLAAVLVGFLLLSGMAAAGQETADEGAGSPGAVPGVPPPVRNHRFTLAVGPSWMGAYPIGDRNAELRRNAPLTPDPSPFVLFGAESSFRRQAGVEARFGVAVTPTLAIEVGGSYALPRIAVSITGDIEAGAQQTLEGERIEQYVVDVSARWQIPRVRFGPRAAPYLTGGGGYLRQLHDDRVLVETGQLYHAGGGVRYWLRGGDGVRRPVGLRAEARAQVRRRGIDFENRTRVFPSLNLFAFVGF